MSAKSAIFQCLFLLNLFYPLIPAPFSTIGASVQTGHSATITCTVTNPTDTLTISWQDGNGDITGLCDQKCSRKIPYIHSLYSPDPTGTQKQTSPDTDTSISYTVADVQDDATYTCKIVSNDTAFTLEANIEKNGRFQLDIWPVHVEWLNDWYVP